MNHQNRQFSAGKCNKFPLQHNFILFFFVIVFQAIKIIGERFLIFLFEFIIYALTSWTLPSSLIAKEKLFYSWFLDFMNKN